MGEESEINEENFDLKAPDGGWGYVIVAANVIMFSVTIVPLAAFGLIYGDFLRNLGDETTGTAMSNGLFNTINSFTGLLASGLLSRYTCRKVAFLGATFFVGGAILLVFSKNLYHIFISFGVLQGIGFGLLLPAFMSAFNSYFDKKMNVMMSICQAVTVAFSIAVPPMAAWSMNTFGLSGTLIGLAILNLFLLPAVFALQPVEYHMKKVYRQTINSTVIPLEDLDEPKKSISKTQIEPLMLQNKHIAISQISLNSKPGMSIVTLGSTSVLNLSGIKDKNLLKQKTEEDSIWQSFLKSMDLSLLKNLKYLNIAIGLSICFTGDIVFVSIIPLMLGNVGFTTQDIAQMMAVFFCSDLISRILLTFITCVVTFRNRFLVLFATLFIAIARTVFVCYDSYMWKLVILGILGFLRCFVLTPMALVLSDEYPDRFSSAFSLFMAVTGVINLIIGPLIRIVANVLLNKYSFRVVALLGSTLNFGGAIATVYASSLSQVILTYSLFQGIGSGLLLPASISTLNAYFDKKMALMTSLSSTIMVIGYISAPHIIYWTLDLYGCRGTLLLLAGLSAFCFPASMALYPVKDLEKVKIEDENGHVVTIPIDEEQDHFALEPLVINKDSLENSNETVIHRMSSVIDEKKGVASCEIKRKEDSFWQSLIHSMDLQLLADPKYLNIATGLSLSFLADVAFFPILPALMTEFGFGSSEVALMISVFFAADLAARITLSVISAFFQVNSLMMVFVASGLSAILRIGKLIVDTMGYQKKKTTIRATR
ncbi:unnamed protein product [Ceutorhynchus assimilis]|uniref:Uncharacterized protein n=1 Tax=Ceutorhynchus assimilis TaxID=467358 RepID=A0A9N9QGP0_9CUCU|nr:unnamed protein product [Ceutorhynchus assimilis]